MIAIRRTSPPPGTGSGLAVVVNANAKRGGRRVAAQIRRALPGAKVVLTKSVAEIADWLRHHEPCRCILSAGGDGSAIALLNALAQANGPDAPFPTVGILPLGTGNGWAHALDTPKLDVALRALAQFSDSLPVRKFGLVEIVRREGPGVLSTDSVFTPFAGAGYDAMVLADFRQQIADTAPPARFITKSAWGYLSAALTRTVPRVLLEGLPSVRIKTLDPTPYLLMADGSVTKMSETPAGAVLFQGTFGGASVATEPEYGYGFRAFPFAERFPGRMNLRIYAERPSRAVTAIPKLWAGAHPLPKMLDFFVTRLQMTFGRPVPFQVGGDSMGLVNEVEMRAGSQLVPMLDWRRLRDR